MKFKAASEICVLLLLCMPIKVLSENGQTLEQNSTETTTLHPVKSDERFNFSDYQPQFERTMTTIVWWNEEACFHVEDIRAGYNISIAYRVGHHIHQKYEDVKMYF